MSRVSDRQSDDRREGLPITGSFILGFAFGAFFDGILLHQVLQWHHLLSLVPGESLKDKVQAMQAELGLWLVYCENTRSGPRCMAAIRTGRGPMHELPTAWRPSPFPSTFSSPKTGLRRFRASAKR